MHKKETALYSFHGQMVVVKSALIDLYRANDSVYFHIKDDYVGIYYKLDGNPYEKYIQLKHKELMKYKRPPVISLCGNVNFKDEFFNK